MRGLLGRLREERGVVFLKKLLHISGRDGGGLLVYLGKKEGVFQVCEETYHWREFCRVRGPVLSTFFFFLRASRNGRN
jgi:hypothetical protein